jgi:3-methyl-2-oxobutanoate hydroxymethyltransferase
MPFMSFQVSPEKALEAAGKLVKEGGFAAVKLEGTESIAEHAHRIVRAGIPVMGHVGLGPQSVHAMGGFRVQGRSPEAAERVLADARAMQDAGVYSMVLEGLPRDLARRITETVSVPTIGIGAGPDCDGQILVSYDLLGLYRGFRPKFVRVFAELGDAVVHATEDYVRAVRDGSFPAPEHSFGPSPSNETAPREGAKAQASEAHQAPAESPAERITGVMRRPYGPEDPT